MDLHVQQKLITASETSAYYFRDNMLITDKDIATKYITKTKIHHENKDSSRKKNDEKDDNNDNNKI